MAYIYSLADTWADGATTFKGIALNVTDSASGADSLLMDLQVGGSSKFNVRKNGNIGIGIAGNASFSVNAAGAISASQYFITANVGPIYWSDLQIHRDAANTLAQRNGVNAQAFNLYNTYTDASNYERGFMRFVSNVLQVGTEKLGTGTNRALVFQTDGATRWTIGTDGTLSSAGVIGIQTWSGNFFGGVLSLGSSERTVVRSNGEGVVSITNNANNSFDRLQFGGTSSSFPAIKRSTTSMQARLADDSAFTNIQGKLTTDTAYTAGAPTATGYIVLFDSTGTAYRVPAVAN